MNSAGGRGSTLNPSKRPGGTYGDLGDSIPYCISANSFRTLVRKLFKFSLNKRKLNAETIGDFQGFKSSNYLRKYGISIGREKSEYSTHQMSNNVWCNKKNSKCSSDTRPCLISFLLHQTLIDQSFPDTWITRRTPYPLIQPGSSFGRYRIRTEFSEKTSLKRKKFSSKMG